MTNSFLKRGDAHPGKINHKFIHEKEGFKKKAYSLETPKGVNDLQNRESPDSLRFKNSGITIGYGFDMGQYNRAELERLGISQPLIDKMQPYLGAKGRDSLNILKEHGSITIGKEEARELYDIVSQDKLNQLQRAWATDSDIPWSKLPSEIRTALLSTSYQYGSLKRKTPKYYRYATQGDWINMYKELNHFKDDYKYRRESEGDQLEPLLKRFGYIDFE